MLGAVLLRFDGTSSEFRTILDVSVSSAKGSGRGVDVGGDLGRVTPEAEPDEGRVEGEEMDNEETEGEVVTVEVECRNTVGEVASGLPTASDGLGKVVDILGLGMVDRSGVGIVDISGVAKAL